MHNLKEILDLVIVKGFPELTQEDICIKFDNLTNNIFGYKLLEDRTIWVYVDNPFKKAPIGVLEGGIAHELVHISTDLSRIGGSINFDLKNYRNSKLYRTLLERNTDLTVILRGFGPQLLSLSEYEQDIIKNGYTKEAGLSRREIKYLLSLHKV